METFKANFVIFLFIVAVSWLGYWAVGNIKDSNSNLQASDATSNIGPVITSGPGSSNSNSQIAVDKKPVEVITPTTNTNPAPTDTNTSSNSNKALIDDLEKLIKDNVLMKKGAQGTRVGTVQKFFNLYGIKMTVDNDFGDTTVNAVKKFQGEQKLTADGQAGAGTYKKMVSWLESH